MICSGAELGLSDESDGILVLPADTPLGVDAVELLRLRDEVLDIAVTPDRGYQLSVRGVAREAATAFGLALPTRACASARADADGYAVRVEDPTAATATSRASSGLDPAASSPLWLQRRLALAGMRPISLAVDVTNHVMLELGQPLHAFDLDALPATSSCAGPARGSG
jgi:phenylalanyl-tRNA synthetase beta chain